MTTWIDNAIDNKYIQLYSYNDFTHITYNGDRGGEGRFGKVACADWPRTNRRVALKKLKSYNSDKFVSEIKMHTTGHSSKNIVRFLGLTRDDDLEPSYIMVFEYADQNNLRTFLQKNKSIEWEVKLKLSLDIAKGLSYLHSLEIVHSDLQSNNVVVNKVHNCKELEFIARITDFGSAIFVSDPGNNDNGVLGQIPFTDPQHLNDRKNCRKDLRSDIYSLGVVLWEISSNTVPFINYMTNLRGELRELCLTMDIIGGYRESRMLLTPEDFVELYKRCWEGEPNRRPEIGEVVEALEEINPILSNSLEDTLTMGEN